MRHSPLPGAAAIDLRVSREGRRLLTVDEDVTDFLPDSSISFPAARAGEIARGTYRVTGVIRPRGGAPVRVDRTRTFASAMAGQLERKTGTPVPAAVEPGRSAWIWLLLGGLLAVVAGVTVAYLRLRRPVRAG